MSVVVPFSGDEQPVFEPAVGFGDAERAPAVPRPRDVLGEAAGPSGSVATRRRVGIRWPVPEWAKPPEEPLVKGLVVFGLLAVGLVVCSIKIATVAHLERSVLWGSYSLVVTGFIFARFGLAALYRPRRPARAATYWPSVAIIVPAYNEQDAISATLVSCLSVAYPAELLTVVVVDDRSTDATLERIEAVRRDYPELVVVAAEVNRGKRHAIAAGIARTDAEVLIFVDSDSLVRPEAVRAMVDYFADPRVGAVAGHTDVWNRDHNVLTRMQAMQYFIAFRVHKAAEALFGAVTCCSGCFSGYRRAAVAPVLDRWVNQRFLGRPSTYGDDRSLTNALLPAWRVLYAPNAQAYTVVPERLAVFLRQQLRWKKSWLRESARASRVMWRKHPVMVLMFYLGVLLPLLAPQVVFRAVIVQPRFVSELPYWYAGGVVLIALFYGFYYRMYRRDRGWYRGVGFALFYAAILVWQMPYALATIRDSRWGTR